jgi:hypothetical protein
VAAEEGARHHGRATERARHLTPPDSEPPVVTLGFLPRASHWLQLQWGRAGRAGTHHSNRPELDRELVVRIPRPCRDLDTYAARVLAILSLASALVAAADPAKVGDLVGNLPVGVYLLIPLALAVALLTSLALGSMAEPKSSGRRVGGMTRALRRDRATHPPSD